MRRRLVFGVLCLCLFGVMAAPVGAVDGGSRDIVSDPEFNFGGPRVGSLYYNQRANGTIQMSVVLKSAEANTTSWLWLSCTDQHGGPRILLADTVSTDAAGRGKDTSIVITAAQLAAGCPAGAIQGHFDLTHAGTAAEGILAAADVDYTA